MWMRRCAWTFQIPPHFVECFLHGIDDLLGLFLRERVVFRSDSLVTDSIAAMAFGTRLFAK